MDLIEENLRANPHDVVSLRIAAAASENLKNLPKAREYARKILELQPEDDGGATIRLSRLELVGYFNLLSVFLNQGSTWADGSPIPAEALRPHRIQLHQLATAIGRTDVAHAASRAAQRA